jgi:hypothetical protein
VLANKARLLHYFYSMLFSLHNVNNQMLTVSVPFIARPRALCLGFKDQILLLVCVCVCGECLCTWW